MKPVKLDHHNFTYAGPTDEIGDLSCFRNEEDGGVYSHWRLSPEEVQAIFDGGLIELGVYVEPIPPVSLNVFDKDHPETETETAFETIKIEGEVFKVPQAVVHEVEALRDKAAGGVRGFEPKPGEAVIITVPDDLSREACQGIGATAKAQYPDNEIAVMPESLGLHASEGLTDLIKVGTEMSSAIHIGDSAGDIAAWDAAGRWDRLISGEQE